MAEKAIQGDPQTLEYLQLEEVEVLSENSATITWEMLCANYHSLAHVLIVAT